MPSYLSKTGGIGGTLKGSPDDFIVEEVLTDGTVLKLGKKPKQKKGSGEFSHFILQKRDWNTIQALKEIANRLDCSPNRFGYAGTKDRKALTVQLCSAWGVSPEQLLGLKLRDIQINGAWKAKTGLKLGDLSGNLFTITVRGARPRSAAKVKKIYSELKGVFPNYFGEQRFGSTRFNTHVVGKLIIRGDLEAAVQNYLFFSQGEEHQEAVAARERLGKEKDYIDALEYFPKHLKYELSMIRHLAQFKNDYAGALRVLPRGISLMFVHAYQSLLFNELLGSRVAKNELKPTQGDWFCPADKQGFPDLEKAKRAKKGEKGFLCLPLIGYESSEIGDEAESLLRKEGITAKSFLIKQIPELSPKGSLRTALAPMKKFSFSQKGDAAAFKFMLQPGAYATSALREFIDEEK